MKRLLVRLYPAEWRARYAEEFLVILSERAISPWDVADVVIGAIDAHTHGERHDGATATRGGGIMASRRWGFAGAFGGLSWSLGLLAVTVDLSGKPWDVRMMWALLPWPWPSTLLMLIGLVLLLGAVVGMSALPARRSPRLGWASVVAAVVAIVLSVVGLLGSQAFWGLNMTRGEDAVAFSKAWDISWTMWRLGMIGVLTSSGLFATAILLSRSTSRPTPIAMMLGSALSTVAQFVGPAIGYVGLKASWWLAAFYVGIVLLAAGWAALGWNYARAVSPREDIAVATIA